MVEKKLQREYKEDKTALTHFNVYTVKCNLWNKYLLKKTDIYIGRVVRTRRYHGAVTPSILHDVTQFNLACSSSNVRCTSTNIPLSNVKIHCFSGLAVVPMNNLLNKISNQYTTRDRISAITRKPFCIRRICVSTSDCILHLYCLLILGRYYAVYWLWIRRIQSITKIVSKLKYRKKFHCAITC